MLLEYWASTVIFIIIFSQFILTVCYTNHIVAPRYANLYHIEQRMYLKRS